MQYHFISDNYFFLLGIKDASIPLSGSISLHKVNSLLRKFRIYYGDVVIIYITNITLRKKLLRLPEIASARVILFKNRRKTEDIKRPANISGYKSFPWCLTEAIDKETLHKVLKWAANAPHARQTFSEQERLLFQYLGDGYNFQKLEKTMRLSRKYLYALKLSTLKKIGLTDGHPARILLCRDVINMSELSPEVYFNSSCRFF